MNKQKLGWPEVILTYFFESIFWNLVTAFLFFMFWGYVSIYGSQFVNTSYYQDYLILPWHLKIATVGIIGVLESLALVITVCFISDFVKKITDIRNRK